MIAIKVSDKHKKKMIWLSVAFLSFGLFWISDAYAMLLAIPQKTEEVKSGSNGTESVNTVGTLRGFGQRIVQPRLDTLVGEIVKDAHADPTGLLWAMYPASVRGRVFSGNVESRNPLVSGGW